MTIIGAPEIKTQDRVIQFFQDQLNYSYLGNLQDQENKNIREDDLKKWLLGQGYYERLSNLAIKQLQDAAANLQGGLYDANKNVYALLKYGAKVIETPGAPKQFILSIGSPTKFIPMFFLLLKK